MSTSSDPSETYLVDPDDVAEFQRGLVEWFASAGRDYPWRRTRDPYAILVSELMLQQTRVATVLEKDYYGRWMSRFPDWEALARADEADVLEAWEGLGYYNRARNLLRAARVIRREHGGAFPESFDEIMALPGVGRYTAGAVFSFAFDRRATIVDGNVIRVLPRLMDYEAPVDTSEGRNRIWEWAENLTPATGVREYNSAIMELGQRLCLRSSPACDACPVRRWCAAAHRGTADRLPRKEKRASVTKRDEHVGIAIRQGEILFHPEDGSRRRGLWRLPHVEPSSADELVELFRFDYAITRYRVSLHVHWIPRARLDSIAGEGGTWRSVDDSSEWPALGAPYRKAVEKYQNLQDDLIVNG